MRSYRKEKYRILKGHWTCLIKRIFINRKGPTKTQRPKKKAEDIKKRGEEDTGELYKKVLNDLDKHDGVVAHLKPKNVETTT